MAFFGHFWAKNAVFFGDGGSETLHIFLQNLAKHVSSDFSTLKTGGGGAQLPTQAPKTLFWRKNGIFWPFWGEKCSFWVMAAPEQSIACSRTLQNTFF